MKTFRLLTAALLLATSASAQRYSNQAPEGEYSPTVYLISVQETENIGCGCAAQEAIAHQPRGREQRHQGLR